MISRAPSGGIYQTNAKTDRTRRCKDCLTTNWGCNWCLNENICLFNTSKCEKTGAQQQQQQLQTRQDNSLVQLVLNGPATTGKTGVAAAAGSSSSRSANTINQVHQCPTFDVGHKQDIVIADGSEKELTIRVKNMPQIKVSRFVCSLSLECAAGRDKLLIVRAECSGGANIAAAYVSVVRPAGVSLEFAGRN